jgi:hypothetical protein
VADNTIVLHFELFEYRNADAVVAAQALIAWVDVVKQTARAINPEEDIRVELVGVEAGSLKLILRYIEKTLSDINTGASEFPLVKKLALGAALTVASSVTGIVLQDVLDGDSQTVMLSEEDRKLLKDLTDKVGKSDAVRKSTLQFFKALEQDPAISGVGVSADPETKPAVIIPKSQFPERSGLWSEQMESATEKTVTAIWNVVLVKPTLDHRPRNWRFDRDGVEFSAKMTDRAFLDAIPTGRVPITLQEGVMMVVEVQYTERLNGQVWEYVANTRKVTKVISPRPSGS